MTLKIQKKKKRYETWTKKNIRKEERKEPERKIAAAEKSSGEMIERKGTKVFASLVTD